MKWRVVLGVGCMAVGLLALVTAVAAFFTDIDPPSERLLWVVVGLVFINAALDYFDDAERQP